MTADPPVKPTAQPQPATDNRMSLVALVTLGTVVVTATGVSLFLWLAWLLARQPLPLRGDTGLWDWLAHVDGTELFDAARTTATVLAIVGIGGAALVAYRRQDTAERAHSVAIEGQQIANAQHVLDSQKYELDRSRHDLEVARRKDDRERELRARFSSIAEQLGSENFAVRHAGAYALAALADDWHRFDNDAERQVCVNFLCAQLRSPRQLIDRIVDGYPQQVESRQDLEVRNTMIALIREHRPLGETSQTGDWKSCLLDLSGADLSRTNLEGMDLSDVNLDDANLTGVIAIGSNLSRAKMRRANITGAEFSGATLVDADFYYARSELEENRQGYGPPEFGSCNLQGAKFVAVSMPEVQFPRADLSRAAFGSSRIADANFDHAKLHGAKLWLKLEGATFRKADLRGASFVPPKRPRAGARFADVNFQDAKFDETTVWPRGEVPDGAVPYKPDSTNE
ncbi:pentapeptide repeat-containing protein [Mycolicibacterium neoaurum]|uniref:pentapeptide repeat-containing protein n=1 Tax=Mycolicibacterium neoaurum TaxID=1795 RepID=UPI001BCC8C30|nr:pentapeptide repeat-containing protein [Mycolicibacterium neoaurum]QVI29267.1 pentapeptide repeat-containing protein [Mycolicibacterium neoaurum]